MTTETDDVADDLTDAELISNFREDLAFAKNFGNLASKMRIVPSRFERILALASRAVAAEARVVAQTAGTLKTFWVLEHDGRYVSLRHEPSPHGGTYIVPGWTDAIVEARQWPSYQYADMERRGLGHPFWMSTPVERAFIGVYSDADLPDPKDARIAELQQALNTAEGEARNGWLYISDDGIEWSANHPVRSGEVPDARNIRPATAANLIAELKNAWESHGEAIQAQGEYRSGWTDAESKAALVPELVAALEVAEEALKFSSDAAVLVVKAAHAKAKAVPG